MEWDELPEEIKENYKRNNKMNSNVNFEITKNGYTLRDSLCLPTGHTFSDAEVEAMKQARFDAWYAVITTPVENPNPEIPTEE